MAAPSRFERKVTAMKHLILGNGPAGVVAAETLRKHAPADSVTLLGDEPGPPYSRMAIPYLLMGNIEEPGTWLRKDPGHFERLGIELKAGRAAAVDPGKRVVRLESGETLAWDRLLVATGSRPNRPPIPGIDLPGVHPCWTLADARAIAARAKKGSRVLQMGAGFIGCIIMEALAARGVELVVVEMGERMVPRMMPPRASELIHAWCERQGVRVITGARVAEIRESGGHLAVSLTDGQTLPADLVISATGVSPNTAFLEGSGVDVRPGRARRTSAWRPAWRGSSPRATWRARPSSTPTAGSPTRSSPPRSSRRASRRSTWPGAKRSRPGRSR